MYEVRVLWVRGCYVPLVTRATVSASSVDWNLAARV